MAKTVKKGLGKGLGALIDEVEYNNPIEDVGKTAEKVAEESSNVEKSLPGVSHEQGDMFVDLDLLKPNPQQPRTEFDADALSELSNSIKEHGVIQPILVEEVGDGSYYIIAGERRVRASKLAGLKKVPVRIKKYSEELKLEVALIENIQRENLNPIEEAIAYKRLMELSNINQEEVASKVGKNRSTVANALRLLKLPEDMQNSLANGAISAGHARALLSVVNPSDQRVLYGRILGSGISVRDAEVQAGELNNGGRSKKSSKEATQKDNVKKNPEINSIEQQFIEALGTKVVLKGDLKRGTIQIEYFSRDDLDRLYDLIIKQ